MGHGAVVADDIRPGDPSVEAVERIVTRADG